MKKNVLITLSAGACLLVSCNKNMPQITEERAIELANEIIARQDNPQVFAQPKNFIYKYSGKTSRSSFDPVYGRKNEETTYEHTFMIDMDNLVLYDYEKETYLGQIIEHEKIDYYDKTGVLRWLHNDNGYKWRSDESFTEIEAEELFEAWRDEWNNAYRWRYTPLGGDPTPFALSEYAKRLEKYQEKRELYKNETDQYCKLYVGSSDAKALQTIVDVKEKVPDGEVYTGYTTYNCSVIIKNDLFSNCTYSNAYDFVSKANENFYEKQNDTASSEMTYGNAHISIPNYLDYKLEELM